VGGHVLKTSLPPELVRLTFKRFRKPQPARVFPRVEEIHQRGLSSEKIADFSCRRSFCGCQFAFYPLIFLPCFMAESITVTDRLPVRNENIPTVLAVRRLRSRNSGKPAVEIVDLGGVAHVLLWFAVVAFDVIKMTQTTLTVYTKNCFSVDLR
jgi:hypothetical protein